MFKNLIKKLKGKPTYKNIKMGSNVHIINSCIDEAFGHLISIGDNVTITNATILAHDASTKKVLGYSKIGKVEIGNDVFIGYGSIILPRTKIGDKVIIAAGSVITKNVASNSVVGGNPARLICTYDEYMQKMQEALQTSHKSEKHPKNMSQNELLEQTRALSDFSLGFSV
ncbi:acyltransferase [Campylobacter sp. JMF_06 NA1]|nr:acyltransferase [Campylobacter sp. JMF_06 NA1]MDA3078460.1 acyltransferase [Campylobacter sp. JMF_06 NA1]